jgi:hypothetical protein
MRLPRLFLIIVLASAVQWGFAQSQPEETFSHNRDVAKSVHIFPNPANADTEFMHVRLEKFPASKVKLTLHNIIGNELPIETEIVDEHEIRIRVKDLASGYYLLAVKDDEAKFRGTYKILRR